MQQMMTEFLKSKTSKGKGQKKIAGLFGHRDATVGWVMVNRCRGRTEEYAEPRFRRRQSTTEGKHGNFFSLKQKPGSELPSVQ
jgi:hypothetical protein